MVYLVHPGDILVSLLEEMKESTIFGRVVGRPSSSSLSLVFLRPPHHKVVSVLTRFYVVVLDGGGGSLARAWYCLRVY